MKVFDKRISKGSMMLFINNVVLLVSLALLLSNFRLNEELNRSRRGYYTENAIQMSSQTDSAETFLLGLQNEDLFDLVVYKPRLEARSDTRGIFFRGRIDKHPIKSGRYFDESDFFVNGKLAVIGENRIKDVITRGDKQFILILGQEFEVIGILGASYPTRLDGMVLIPLDTAVALTGTDGIFYLDGRTSQSVAANSQHLSVILRDENIKPPIINLDIENRGFFISHTVNNIYILIFFAFFLTTAFANMNWIAHRSQMIYVERLFGMQNCEISVSVYSKYLLVSVTSSIASSILVLVISVFNNRLGLNVSDIIIANFVVLIAGGAIISTSMARTFSSKEILLKR